MNIFFFGDNVLCRILIINTSLKTIHNQKEIGKYIQIQYLKCKLLTIKRVKDQITLHNTRGLPEILKTLGLLFDSISGLSMARRSYATAQLR